MIIQAQRPRSPTRTNLRKGDSMIGALKRNHGGTKDPYNPYISCVRGPPWVLLRRPHHPANKGKFSRKMVRSWYREIWGVRKLGVPQSRWFTTKNPIIFLMMWGYPHLRNLHLWWSLERILRTPTKTEQVVPWAKETYGKRSVWNWYQTKNWYCTLIEYVFRICLRMELRGRFRGAGVLAEGTVLSPGTKKRDQSRWWWALKEGKVPQHTVNRIQNSILPNHEIKRST